MSSSAPLMISVIGKLLDYTLPKEIFSGIFKIKFENCNSENLSDPLEIEPDIILYLADGITDISPLESAQCLRANYAKKTILYLTTDKATFDKKNLIKNGFTSAYILPWEKYAFLNSLEESSFYAKNPELKDYIQIQVLDLYPGTVLDFSTKVYLPVNNKVLFFSREGEVMTEEKIKILKRDSRNTVLVHKDELKVFYDYTAQKLKDIGKDGTLSETQKKAKLEACVRDLVSDMFISNNKENTFGKSQQLLKDFKEIIKLMMSDNGKNISERLSTMTNKDGDFYNHLSNVSTLSVIFGMAIGMSSIEEMALAGMLHDVGKTNFPKEMVDLPFDQLSPISQSIFQEHPAFSIDICKLKRFVISENIHKIILQHHERIDGTGYPKGLSGDRMLKEAKVLAIANKFDHLTSLVAGEKLLSPISALDKLIEENTQNPSQMELDKDILIEIKTALTKKITK